MEKIKYNTLRKQIRECLPLLLMKGRAEEEKELIQEKLIGDIMLTLVSIFPALITFSE